MNERMGQKGESGREKWGQKSEGDLKLKLTHPQGIQRSSIERDPYSFHLYVRRGMSHR